MQIQQRRWPSLVRPLPFFLTLATSLLAATTFAQTPIQAAPHDAIAPEQQYGGVVVNQTVTVAGNDFYQYFVMTWRESDLSERFVVSVHELPSARWGSRVWVEYAQRRVFQANLPAARAAVKAISMQAAEVVQQRIADTEVERVLFREADLGADEI